MLLMPYSGALLPGQQLSFPFVFKSPNAGIFKEMWALQTGPVLAGGRGVRVLLRGVAFKEDTNAHKRDELEVYSHNMYMRGDFHLGPCDT